MDDRTAIEDDPGLPGSAFAASCRERLTEARALRDRIAGIDGPGTAAGVLAPLNDLGIEMDGVLAGCELYESVHPDEGVRKAAEIVKQEATKLASELSLDRKVFRAVSSVDPAPLACAPEAERFLAHTLRDFRRAGVDADSATRTRIQELNEELVVLGQEFNRNIREDRREILLDGPADLAGLPEDYVASHAPGADGKIRVTTDTPDLAPFMTYARNGRARALLHALNLNRAYPRNIEVLSRILVRRHELARLLGHDSYASYAAEDKMIRTADAIADFVRRIADDSRERMWLDYTAILERKRADDPSAIEVRDDEKAFYGELARAGKAGFKSQEIRPYLPFSRAKAGVLEVTQRLFGLEYRKVDEPAWHPSVETFDVYDDGERVGRFLLDLHPRDGKYKHAAMFPIRSGVLERQLPEAALVCNFPDPGASSGPALLEHGDLVTLFHEFGHLLHHILGGRRRYVRFSGVATEWDFVEVPSQLLEEWAYDPDCLASFAAHHETGAPIPREMIDRLNAARSFGRGLRVTQQMLYAAVSLEYHDRDPEGLDTTALLAELQNRMTPFRHVDGTHMQASFGHLEGYSALYYSYMWSLAIVRDLLGEFRRAGLFAPDVAARYARCVLAPGGSKDAAELVRDFLGRGYDLEAFGTWLAEGARGNEPGHRDPTSSEERRAE
ncbi:MAG: Zn-dependent oligopeptidase [Deltaproteobacteria bacterium]|nr:Zn-dependent oligopeptidase [Deltaproteobacteria bacterium]